MLLIPAIDLMDGQVVRLRQGDFAQASGYSADPVALARSYHRAGAPRIHLVDLDAARGKPDRNAPVIRTLCAALPGVVQVGGGVRSAADVRRLLDAGAARVVVGTTLAREPERVEKWISDFGRVFIAAIDSRDGEARIEGWRQSSGIQDHELARVAADLGILAVLHTAIARDGMMSGPDIAASAALAAACGLPIILSGGVSRLQDLEEAAKHSGIDGAVSGRALLDGELDLELAIRQFATRSDNEW